VKFSASTLRAPAGRVSVTLANRDPFVHNITIDALHVQIVAGGNQAREGSFTAAPGTYTFYCSIPGHRAAGMVGTLTVTASGSSP
jgi:plastocyanin